MLRAALRDAGPRAGKARTQIIPVAVGDPARAVAACARALEEGVFAQAIRPPTVPEGTSRLRLTVMATHRPAELRGPRGIGRGRPRRLRRRRLDADRAADLEPARGRPKRSDPDADRASRAPAGAPGRRSAAIRRERRAVRHRHRHRGRQERRRRGARREARGRGQRVAASSSPPSRASTRAARATTRCCAAPPAASRPRRQIAPYRFGPPLSPHLAAELAGESRSTRAAARRRAAAARRGRRAARLRGRRRAAGAAHAPTTWSATSPSSSATRSSSSPRRARDDQPHAADARGRAGAPGSRCARWCSAAGRPRRSDSSAPTGRRSPRWARSRS